MTTTRHPIPQDLAGLLPQDSLASAIVLALFAALIGWLLLCAMTVPRDGGRS